MKMPRTLTCCRRLLFPLLFLLAGVLGAWMAVSGDSVTVDEYVHLPAGAYALHTGHFQLQRKSPPLARMWAALPAVLGAAVIPDEACWTQFSGGWDGWIYGTAFQLRNLPAYDRLYSLGRLLNGLWLIPLGLALFLWAERLFGRRSAWALLVMLVFSPTFLAHGPRVTTDLAATTCFVLYVCLLRRILWREGGMCWSLALGVILGVGLLVKLSLVLAPLVGLSIQAGILLCEGSGNGRERGGGRQRLLRHGGLLLRSQVLPLAVAVLLINALYRFQGSGRALGSYTFESQALQRLGSTLPGFLPVPLPSDYVLGFDGQKRDAETGEFPAYLLGKWSTGALRSYFPLTLLTKTPLALPILLGLGLLAILASAATRRAPELLFVALPPALLLAVMVTGNHLYIGIRYCLPILPFLFLLAAAAFRDGVSRRERLVRRVAWVLLLSWVVSTVSQYPYYLAYFNEAARGPGLAGEVLLDSNLDWGQDLKRLGAFVEAQRIPMVYLAYFGHVWPQQYAIPAAPPPNGPVEGWVAISISLLKGQVYARTYLTGELVPLGGEQFAWLRGLTPVAKVGRSILVYHLGPGGVALPLAGAAPRP